MNNARILLKNPLVIILPIVTLLLLCWQQYTHAEPTISIPTSNIMKNNDFAMLASSGIPEGWQLTDKPAIAVSMGDSDLGFRQLTLSRADDAGTNSTLSSPATDVDPGDAYFYKSFYKSDQPFDLLLRTTDQDNRSKQTILGHYAPTEQWTAASYPFVADEHAKNVQLVYSFAGKGSLQLGNAYLEPAPADAQPTPDKVTAPNLLKGGKPGDSELKPINTTEGRQYRFVATYRSDTPVDVVAKYTLPSGEQQQQTLRTLLPAHDWTVIDPQYAEVPTDATTINMQLVKHGGDAVDAKNYELQDITKSGESRWSKPYVSFTFDDGWNSVYRNGTALLNQAGIKGTFYIDPKSVDTNGFMTSEQVAALKKDGHELASHGYEHMNFTTLPSNSINYQMQRAYEYFNEVHDEKSVNFAAPYGSVDAQLQYYVHKYYRSLRGTQDGINTKQNFDPYNLRALYIGYDTPVSKIVNTLNEAQASRGWLILIYHKIANGDTKDHSTITPAQFQQQIDAVRQSGISSLPVSAVLDDIGNK